MGLCVLQHFHHGHAQLGQMSQLQKSVMLVVSARHPPRPPKDTAQH
jgi:hypothetical protein